MSGAIEDTRLLHEVGRRIAELQDMPAWNEGDEFESACKQAIKNLDNTN